MPDREPRSRDDRLVRRTALTTRDFGRAVAIMAARSEEHHARLVAHRERFVWDITMIDVAGVGGVGPVGVDRVYAGAEITDRFTARDDTVTVVGLTAGGYEHDRTTLGPGGLLVLTPGRPHRVRSSDVAAHVARLDVTTVARVAADATGIAPEALRFHDGDPGPLSARHADLWRAALRRLAVDLVPDEDLVAAPLVRAEAIRALALAALATFPNTALDATLDPWRAPVGWSGPATVRRAVAHIDDHADLPLDLAGIAAAAGVGPRALQIAFRRHRDQTPGEYLREVRLRHVHDDLRTADPAGGVTVAAVAARWGFTNAGRLATAYRRTFGVTPHQTLHGRADAPS